MSKDFDHNICLTIAYDGKPFLGWQKTEAGTSIEGTLQELLEQILQHPVHLEAASRTDRGVHALGQRVHFFTSKHIDLSKLRYGLNRLLPPSIAILEAEAKPLHFHPTLDVVEKTYSYALSLGPVQMPQERLYRWHQFSLDIDAMQKASSFFIGTHDFATFCNVHKNANYTSTVRTLRVLSFTQTTPTHLDIILSGPHFLYKMARNIVGTLVDVGRGKIPVEAIPHLLKAKDRTLAGVTAPAHGLTLISITYS